MICENKSLNKLHIGDDLWLIANYLEDFQRSHITPKIIETIDNMSDVYQKAKLHCCISTCPSNQISWFPSDIEWDDPDS